MKLNTPKSYRSETHEGGTADPHQTPAVELERAVATCLLGESTFYERGADLKARIGELCLKVDPAKVSALAVRAREEWKLRHVPLWIVRQLCRVAGAPVAATLARVIQRPDEMAEFLALYWDTNDGKRSLPAQVKRGLAAAFQKFSEYDLAKWNRDGKVKLRDALFLSHAKPRDEEQAALWKRLVSGELATPDTWETTLSAVGQSQDLKAAAWTRLLTEKKLGDMALLMNLRNMIDVGVDLAHVRSELERRRWARTLPFRFVAAWRSAPALAGVLDEAMRKAMTGSVRLPGSALVVVDVSGSMDGMLSGRSTLSRLDAAGALAVLIRESCDSARVVTFSSQLVEVPSIGGLALLDGIHRSQPHGNTMLAAALHAMREWPADWIFVLTDEQAHDGITPSWAKRGGYIVNVAPYEPALPTTAGGWRRLSGFSERLLDWVNVQERAS